MAAVSTALLRQLYAEFLAQGGQRLSFQTFSTAVRRTIKVLQYIEAHYDTDSWEDIGRAVGMTAESAQALYYGTR